MHNRGEDTYFGRLAMIQPSGNQYDQRTREAVNAVAARISSYRELVAALAQAVDGSVLEITQKIVVPKTILIQNNKIKITCTGDGGIIPDAEGLTLFSVVDADDIILDSIKVYKNDEGVMFEWFIDFNWIEDKKNIYITNNYVESLNFMNTSFSWAKAITPVQLDTTYLNLFVGQRTYLIGNTHRNYQEAPRINATRFLKGFPHMFTLTNNETESSIEILGVGNIINSSAIFGLTDGVTNTSVYIPSTRQNVVVGNLVASGGAPVVFIDNTAANNQEIAL